VHRYPGFDSLQAMWNALISRRFYAGSIFPWEYDCYIGWMGISCVLAFLFIPLLLPACRRAFLRYWPIALPAAVLLLLSFTKGLYFVLQHFPAPLLATQRVPSRLIIMPVVFAVAVACISATNLLSISRRGARVAVGVAGLFVAGYVLRGIGLHAVSWRLAATEAKSSFLFLAGNSPLPLIVSRHDPAYVTAVWVSLTLSVVTLGAILWWLWRTRRDRMQMKER
jgi:hypothetical protein